MVTISSIAVSQVGKIREHNEDAVLVGDNNGLWVLADGMGGHASGEVASQLAIDVVAEKVAQQPDLKQAIADAHQQILAQAESNPEQQGMGTTIVAACKNRHGFNIAWVGDSRAYLYEKCTRAPGLKQITTDHTFVQDMVYREVLTAEEAENHPQGNLINRSLGMTEGRFKVDEIQLRPKSTGYLLLCSDGVSDYISHEQLQVAFSQAEKLEEIAEAINGAVLETEAADNFSFIIVLFEPGKLSQWRNRLLKKN